MFGPSNQKYSNSGDVGNKFYGPYENSLIFSDNDCPNIGNSKQPDLTNCENFCNNTEGCTAINYNADNYACIARGCPVGTNPTGSYSGFTSYTKYPPTSYDPAVFGKLWTTIQGGGKFLGVTDGYECEGNKCQKTDWWPGDTHGLIMKDFDYTMLSDTSYQFTLDPVTQRPSVNYKGTPYYIDYTWPGDSDADRYMLAPYVTTPSNFYSDDFQPYNIPEGSRNFNAFTPWGFLHTGYADIGMCYDPSILSGFPITKGTSIRAGDTNPGDEWPADAITPACNWIDFNNVYRCCAEIGYANQHSDICSTDPNGYSQNGSLPCQQIMLKMCQNNWDQDVCKLYLQSFENGNGIKDVSTVFQTAIINYINGMGARTGCGGNDYTSPNTPNTCTPTTGPNAGIPRDDSKDTFINGTMLNFCSTNASSGVCDNILYNYCSQFTRSDLNNDSALQTLCGCHISDGTTLAPGTGCINSICLNLDNKTRPPNQYIYPGFTKACDPLCAFAGTLQSAAPQCNHTICVMDDVGIQYINSNCGDANINQVCGANYQGTNATGLCYMSNVDIDTINSTCGGATISQNCKACFSFTPGDPSSAVPVDCKNPSGRSDSGGTGGSGGSGGSGSSGSATSKSYFSYWFKAHPFYATGLIVFIIVLIFIIIYFGFT